MRPPRIEEASIDWSDTTNPTSKIFGDVYYSRYSGKAESEHVFINGNRLKERFSALAPGSRFTIAETGFGCGLNFLVTWHTWRLFAPKEASLHFVSVEKYPLSSSDLETSHRNWPEFQALTDQIKLQYPPPIEGIHRCQFQEDRVFLTLCFANANDWLQHCSFKSDAWFLDGFNPQQNPQMWNKDLFKLIASHSAESTTLATYTSAGFIRRGLQEHGFNIARAEGFAAKRHMTIGIMGSSSTARECSSAAPKASSGTTASASTITVNQGRAKESRIIVIGSGLAGAMTALSLAKRGFKVQVFEKGGSIASGASGNAQGALYLKLAVDWNPHTKTHLSHYLYARRAYAQLLNLPDTVWSPTGVIQLAYDKKEQSRQQKFILHNDYPETIVHPVSAAQASQIAGVKLEHNGLFFPEAGWLCPAELCRHLLQHPFIQLHLNTDIIRIEDDPQGGVCLTDAGEKVHNGEVAILAQGHSDPILINYEPKLPFKAISGQISLLQTSGKSLPPYPLKTVLCSNGYALPEANGNVVFGATFNPNSANIEMTSKENQENLDKLAGISPQLAEFAKFHQTHLHARKSVRCALPDYLPMIGPLVRLSCTSVPAAGHSTMTQAIERYAPNIYINTGYGSKGLAIAPLAAEIIADMIEEVPRPIEDNLLHRLSGERFIHSRKPGQ